MCAYKPRIALVGGGPASLTVGNLLHKHNIPFTIFELRPQPTEEDLAKPVGMLDLHEESGLAALEACGLSKEFHSHTGVCSESQIIANKEGDVIYTDDGGVATRPEISRNSLTKILLDRLPPDSVKWEHKLISASRITSSSSGDMEIELDFDKHGKHTFDFVIGADGTWSRVRNLLTDTKPSYAGWQLITVTIRDVTVKYPEFAQYIGTGSFMCLGQRHGVLSQRGLQDSARIYVCLTTADEHFGDKLGLNNGTPAEAINKLLNDNALLGQFGPKVKDLVRIACDEETKDNPDAKLGIMPLYMLPIDHSWEHKTGATVIGDAAHVMCPWAAEGVNLAMHDALDLSQAIIKASETVPEDAASFQRRLDVLVEEFERAMAERAKEKAEETYNNGQVMFSSEDGATAMAEWMTSMMAMVMAQQAEAGEANVKVMPE
ncbi:salicylate hydroxylase [Exophiala viscosa]|uniref:Salicylate hydroxylase n=1 Tax=Exophiala viscosa TaxID=2486360 RepID=A0AAN6E4Y3_9EURO|nr:salicylate hydroxylase [Exophiala viscosa]KAI1627205.1 salicylate hydroxylase [Exophiala viscosa]